MKYFFTALIFFGIETLSFSQVVMNLQLPPAGILQKEQLWNLSLINSGATSVQVQLEMQLSEEATQQRVLTGLTREFVLPKGVSQIRQTDIYPVVYNALHPSYPVDIAPNGLLPIGIFNVCFSLISLDAHGERIGDVCEVIAVEPLSPPMLVLPADGEQLESSRPVFTWVPPAPVSLFRNLSYDLDVVEILPAQSPGDAIVQNIPLLHLSNLQHTSVMHPPSLTGLDTAKQYAWRVKANNDGMAVANSETWVFRVASGVEQEKEPPPLTNYTRLSRGQDGAFATCKGVLLYEYIHPLNDTSVNLRLYDVTRPGNTPVPGITEAVPVRYGTNFLRLDLAGTGGLTTGHMYLMELVNTKGEKWYLKFQYSKP